MMNDDDRWAEHMRAGRFEHAWQIRDRIRGEHLFDGRPLGGKRVILLCNGGLGDAVQLIRYVPMLTRVASEVIVVARPDAVPLLRKARGVPRVVPLGEPVEADVTIDIMQIMHVFRTRLRTIPCDVPYLDVEPVQLSKQDRLHVGVGFRTSGWDPLRDVPESLIEELQGVVIHRLDRNFGPATPLDVARLIKALDLVIAADTFYAHVAGAMAVPVWTLLRANAEWRWLADRSDSPWYPTMRLFRQREPGDWRTVVREVSTELCYLPRTFKRS